MISIARRADDFLERLLVGPEGVADPYPLYRRLRELAPVHRREADGAWYVSRFDDCSAILRDPRCDWRAAGAPRPFAPPAGNRRREELLGPKPTLLTADAAGHLRLRRVAGAAFTPRRLATLRPSVEALVDDQLEVIGARGEVDVLADLARPLHLAVTGELVGVPRADDRQQFRSVISALDTGDEADVDGTSGQGIEATRTYFAELAADRRAHPCGDMLSDLAAACDGEAGLDKEEVVSTAILIFLSGFTNTVNLIGNGLLALLRHPRELNRLRDDPGLAPSAVEECLRYDTPSQTNARGVYAALEIAGHSLEPGDTVVTLIGAANRDPIRFSHPDRFDIGRRGNQALSFGSGSHHCLGAGLVRLAVEVLFVRLLDRFPSIELLDEDPPRRPGLSPRSLKRLRIRVMPR